MSQPSYHIHDYRDCQVIMNLDTSEASDQYSNVYLRPNPGGSEASSETEEIDYVADLRRVKVRATRP